MKYNRNIRVELREVDDLGLPLNIVIGGFNFNGQEKDGFLPLDISGSISKSITSVNDTATINIVDPPVIERLYLERDLFIDEVLDKNLIVNIFFSYGDNPEFLYFSGDLVDISVNAQNGTNDQTLTLNAVSGERAFSKARINQKILAGQTYGDIVRACFDILDAEFGIELAALDDPLNKLDKEILKIKTKDISVQEALNQIARDLDMVFGIAGRAEETGKQKGYFVDKRSSFDAIGIFGKGVFDVNSQTGLLSPPSFSRTSFTFNHAFDDKISIGSLVEVGIQFGFDVATLFRGRVSQVSTNFSNKQGGFAMSCSADFTDQNEPELAKLINNRRNVGAELL